MRVLFAESGFGYHVKEPAMLGFKRTVFGSAAAVALACALATPAAAGVQGFFHPWGFGRGLVGAAVGLATLPLAIASAALSAGESQAPYQPPGYAGGYGSPPAYYAAPPAYYRAPQAYYAPPRAYYPRAPVYYPAPRAYYAPRSYYAPRAGYYAGHGSYHSGGYSHPHR